MPAYALQIWQPNTTEYELPKEVTEVIDNCEEGSPTSKKKLKRFLLMNQIQSIAEMDYTLRQAYLEHLLYTEQLAQPSKHTLVYDRVKQAYIKQRMQTLPGQMECAWRLEDKILFLPYHPDAEIAKEFDSVRNRANMVWDFSKLCSKKLKEQIFTTLTMIIETPQNSRIREHKLSGLQSLYEFCIESEIADIEMMDSREEQQFEQYLMDHIDSVSRKMQLFPILNLCRKSVFLQSKEINWKATVWYLDRLHLAPHRINESNLPQTVAFKDITMPENRRYAQEFMRYQLGITGQAVSTLITRYNRVQQLLCWLSDTGMNVCDCNANVMERYIAEIEKQEICAKTFNEYLSGLAIFFRFLVAKGYIRRMPFYPEYFQKKVIPQHHDRSVSPDVCMEMLQKVHNLPEHLRCMYLHL